MTLPALTLATTIPASEELLGRKKESKNDEAANSAHALLLE